MSLTVVKASDFADDTILFKTTVSGVEVIQAKTITEVLTLLGFSKYKGEYTQSQVSSIDTSSYAGGEWINVTDVPKDLRWSGTEWV